MNIENHTVTLPVSDYKELFEAKEFIGAQKLGEDSDIYIAVKNELIKKQSPYDRERGVNPMVQVELFVKIKPVYK